MIRRVLLPLDVSRDFQEHIRYGTEIAASMTAELCLLHVSRSSVRCRERRWFGEPDLDEDVRRFFSQTAVRRGSPAEMIASYANFIDADLILIPTRGRGLLGQLLFGSTTVDLLRMANRPLWVAKPQSVTAEKPRRCKRILCGVELGAQGESVLRYAARLARAHSGEILIVHAVPEISEAMLVVYGLDHAEEIELLPEAAHRRTLCVAAAIEAPYQVEVRTGDVATILQRFAKRWRADIMVVGRGRSTNQCRFGANIGSIIARSPCPVIAYPDTALRPIRPNGPGPPATQHPSMAHAGWRI